MEALPEALMGGFARLFEKLEESCGFVLAWLLTIAAVVALVLGGMWAIASLA